MMISYGGHQNWPRMVLEHFFTLGEWETAFDFYEIPLVETYNPNDFKVYQGTLYSLDGRVKRRIVEGKSVSKGKQKSAICIYNRSERLHENRPCTRFEIRHQGYNSRDLSFDLLDGDIFQAFEKLLPSLSFLLQRQIPPTSLVFTAFWKENAPDWFRRLLEAAKWDGTTLSEYRKPRRKG
jgi:hypothetical protein